MIDWPVGTIFNRIRDPVIQEAVFSQWTPIRIYKKSRFSIGIKFEYPRNSVFF